MSILSKFMTPKAESSPLSDFVRNMSAGEKKKLFNKAINQATQAQNEIIKQANAQKNKA